MTGPGLKHLKTLVSLQVLDLSFAPVTDLGLAHLPPNVQKLLLRGTKVSDAGLEHLERLTHLEYLDLSETTVAGPGLRHLTGLANLQKLILWRTSVTKDDPLRRDFRKRHPS